MLKKGAIVAEPVLADREQELAELMQSLNSASNGKGITVFVSGEAGSGKTRLTTEFLVNAKKKGTIVLTGSCLGNVAVPYFPFVEAFDAYFAAEDEDEQVVESQQPGIQPSISNGLLSANIGAGIMTWLSGPTSFENSRKPEWISPQVWRDKTFAAVARTLRSIAVEQPLILFLEDIHWADSASLGLLHYIAKVIGSEKIMLMATFRSEELTVDEEGRPHPLLDALQLMRRENLFKEIRLQGLGKEGIGKVAESMVSGAVDPVLVEKLTEESRGNPLFVVESLRMLQERNSLLQENNQWRLVVDELGIPSKIKEIIIRRLGTLKLAQRRVLDAASVIGDKFNVELLGAVLKQDSLDVLETLNFVAQSTSLVCCEQDFFRFDHAKSREALYEEIPLPLRKGYHARVAEKLETSAENAKLPSSELAYHYAQAGNKEKALTYSMAAGNEALARFSNNEAISRFKYVVNSVGEAPERANERLAALEGLGDAYFANSMFKEGEKTFELLANLATGATRLRAFNKAIDSAFIRGDGNYFAEMTRKAEETRIVDRIENAKTSFAKLSALWSQNKHAEGMKNLRDTVRVFEEEYSLWNAAWYLNAFGSLCFFHDELEEGVVAFLRAIALSGDLGDYRLQANCYQTTGQLMYVNCGTEKEASDMLEKSVKLAEKIADYNKLAETYTVWSWTFAGKDPKSAIEKCLKAKEYVEKTDSIRVQAMVYSTLARTYLFLGDAENAEKYYSRLIELPKEVLYMPGPQGLQTVALFLAAKGRWKESDEYFQKQFEFNKRLTPGARGRFKANYALALEMRGHFDEAKKLRAEAQAVKEELSRRFDHANLCTVFMAPIDVIAGREFDARLDIVNPSRAKGALVKIEKLLSPELEILALKPEATITDGILELKDKTVDPFTVKTIKLTLRATRTGTLTLTPQVVYIDNLGLTKTSTSNLLKLTAKPSIPTFETLPGRSSTGTAELDQLLFGGVPQNYAVVLAGPSSEEKEMIINRFLETGAKSCEVTLYVTSEAGTAKVLAENYPSNFYLILCNLQADSMIENLSNVFKVKGIESLTEIDIALSQAFRMLSPHETGPRRICLDILSDALLQHHAVSTRKWMSALLPSLKSKGFTVLATINPQMHEQEEVQALLGLFQGEIIITEQETGAGLRPTLRVRKLIHQKHSEDEIVLTKEK